MFQISQKGLFEVKFCVVKCLANVYIKITVLIMACCNSIFVLQGLILGLHDVLTFSNAVPNKMYFGVFRAISAMLIKIVFFIQEMGGLCIF